MCYFGGLICNNYGRSWVNLYGSKVGIYRPFQVVMWLATPPNPSMAAGICGQTILHSDDSTMVLNVKDVRTGQKMELASGHRYPASDSIDNALLRWFELLLGTRSSLLWPSL